MAGRYDKGSDSHDERGPDLYAPTIRLLASIIKIARDDWLAINERPDIVEDDGKTYVDREHRSICDKGNFSDGIEELEYFLQSEWFDRICAEIDFEPDEVREIICGEYLL